MMWNCCARQSRITSKALTLKLGGASRPLILKADMNSCDRPPQNSATGFSGSLEKVLTKKPRDVAKVLSLLKSKSPRRLYKSIRRNSPVIIFPAPPSNSSESALVGHASESNCPSPDPFEIVQSLSGFRIPKSLSSSVLIGFRLISCNESRARTLSSLDWMAD